MELGVKDEGVFGLCMDVYYCVYFWDLDGNKINCFCMVWFLIVDIKKLF